MTELPPPEPDSPPGGSGGIPPPPDSPPPGVPTRAFGAPRSGAVPRMETVRITAPDLERRAAMRKTHNRLAWAALGFMALFLAVAVKLADATIVQPLKPREAAPVLALVDEPAKPNLGPHIKRAMIVDRNNQILAISLPTAEMYANPREMIDTAEAAHKLKLAVPRLDEDEMRQRLGSGRAFVYLARRLSPREELKINDLGIPGIYFEPSEQRHYPLGRVAAQVLGGVDIDEHGVAGVEKALDQRLTTDSDPLRLSLDVRVQAVVREELSKAMDEFQAIGACGIVMDVRTGEVLAMVSLPDYDANDFGSAPAQDRFNRAVTGMYEPGSTFKLQTAAMALDSGAAHLWDEFDAAHPIHVGRFTITDFEGKHRFLYLPEVLAYSSNLGAAHIAMVVGAERQRAWLQRMGMFRRLGIELPEAGLPIVPPAANWKELTTMTVGFGHGIAVSPLHVVRGTAALANGGYLLRPTLLARDGAAVEGTRVMQQWTSDILRRLMRLVVTNGYGKPADVPGYFVGGKTGTAEKVGAHGYKKHTNISAFISVFPMNAPRYAVYMMLDEPHGNKSTGFFSTAGVVSAPAAGRVIARIAPMLGLFPDTQDAAAIQASLAIPLQPARGYGGGPRREVPTAVSHPELGRPQPAGGRPAVPVLRDLRHEASLRIVPDQTAASAIAAR
jgi:cell division protein FtsI (penicillin-binding protein 3)